MPPDDFASLLKIQRDLAIALLQGVDPQDCLELLLTAALQLPGCDADWVSLATDAGGGLRVGGHRGLSDSFAQQASNLPVMSLPCGPVQTASLTRIEASGLPAAWAEALSREGFAAIGVLPLRIDEEIVAALSVASRGNPPSSTRSLLALDSLIELTEGNIAQLQERRWTLRALRQSEEKHRKLHQSMQDAFVLTNMDGRILESNQAYRDLLGYSEEELSRLTYIELTPERWRPMEQELVEAQILEHDFSEVYEKEYVRKDGTLLPVELRTFLIRDGTGAASAMWAIVRDLTDRKATEEITRQWQQTLERRLSERAQQLRQSEARFRQLAEATFEGIVISEDGIILDGNPQLAAMFGYDLAEMIGHPVMDFVPPESRPKFAEILRENTDRPYEWIGMRKDGSLFPVAANPRIRQWQDRTVRITALRDLTENKRVAAKIQEQETELEQVQRLALISEISAGIIHQISQPISAVSNNLAAAMITPTSCKSKHCKSLEVLHEIQEETVRMREIVIHLRALADPEQPNRSSLDFNSVLADVLPLLQREATTRQIRLEAAPAPNHLPIQGDAVQLKQVVLNLARNAFDACTDCPPPRRQVYITTRSIPKQGIELTVRDAGVGIAPADEHRLFGLFFTTKQEGRGVGLRLCRTIVQAHDGSIEAANNPDGIGAVFRVLLPADFQRMTPSPPLLPPP